jgi:flagellar hook-associated protein 1 FlgK
LLTQLGEVGQLTSVVIPGQLQAPRVYYRNLVGWVGARTQEAQQMQEIAKTHTRVSQQQRQSQWGVSLDEETALLTMQQQAFSAAARVLTVMDDMLDTLINRTAV